MSEVFFHIFISSYFWQRHHLNMLETGLEDHDVGIYELRKSCDF